EQHGARYSIGVSQHERVRRAVEQIPEQSGQALDDSPPEGRAESAEGSLGARRPIVRRARLVGAQAEPFPDRRDHAFISNRVEPPALAERDHRRHAQIELATAPRTKAQASTTPPAGLSPPTPPGRGSARSHTTAPARSSSSASARAGPSSCRRSAAVT